MNFREFLNLIEQSPMKTGQAPNKPANLSKAPVSDFGGGGPSKGSPRQPTSRPPGSGNYDYPVKIRPPGQVPVTLGLPKVVPGAFGGGGPGPDTPKYPAPPGPKPMKKGMKKK